MRASKNVYHPHGDADDFKTVEDTLDSLDDRVTANEGDISTSQTDITIINTALQSATAAGQVLVSNGSGASTAATFKALVDGIAGWIGFPDNIRYDLWIKSPFAMTITSTTTFCQSGSCTATFTVNTGSIGGTANAVSTTQQTQAHSFSVAAGDTINMTISSNSSCQYMALQIAYTRP